MIEMSSAAMMRKTTTTPTAITTITAMRREEEKEGGSVPVGPLHHQLTSVIRQSRGRGVRSSGRRRVITTSRCPTWAETPCAEPLLRYELHAAFTRLVKRGFSQRRKMMLKLLKQDWPEEVLRRGFAQAGLTPQTRAEETTLEQFALPGPDCLPMNEEIFDIVNGRDEVIGRLPRAQAHREGRKHRAVHVLVFNARGEVFLQKRSRTKDTFPGAWDSSCSGHLDSGEDYDAGAVRELGEELGLVLKAPPRRLFKIAACEETG